MDRNDEKSWIWKSENYHCKGVKEWLSYEYIKYIIRNKEPLRIADDSTSQSGQTVTLRYIPGTTMRGYIINKMAPSSDFEQLKEELFSEQVKYLNAYLCVKEKNNEKNSRVQI